MELMEVMEVNETRASYGAAPRSHRDLQVYQRAFDLAIEIGRIEFPREEQFGLQSQIRRSSRSVCANLAEAWRKRRYQAAFVAKLSDAESEAAETQTWLEFALAEGHIDNHRFDRLMDEYESLLKSIVGIIQHADKWVLK